jgi:hypothetical protein
MRKAKFIYNYIMLNLCGFAILINIAFIYNGKTYTDFMICCFMLSVIGFHNSIVNILSLYKE